MKRKVSQIDLVLSAIHAGARVVNRNYLGDVLCLACRGSLTSDEMRTLVMPNGRRMFADSLEMLRECK